MLDAGARARDHQRGREPKRATAQPRQRIPNRGEHSSEDQDRSPTKMVGKPARRYLQEGHGAGIETAQQCKGDIVETELGPPHWKKHVDGVGVAIVQSVSETGESQSALARVRSRWGWMLSGMGGV